MLSPTVRLAFDQANYGYVVLVVFVAPVAAVVVTLSSRRAGVIVAGWIVLAIQLLVALLVAFLLLFLLNEAVHGHDDTGAYHQRVGDHRLPGRGYLVAYKENGGALGNNTLMVRQEWEAAPGVLLVRVVHEDRTTGSGLERILFEEREPDREGPRSPIVDIYTGPDSYSGAVKPRPYVYW
ncbi:MAG: hypothetical protein ACRCYQ_15725 [Nocardioides sp.]